VDRQQLERPDREHDAPARRRGTAHRDRAALGRVAKARLVERALHDAVQVGVHADTLPPTAGGRIGDITGALFAAVLVIPLVVVTLAGAVLVAVPWSTWRLALAIRRSRR
jgi:hypothetical protein